MEFEFDKEIDALLRQTAKGETAFSGENPQSAIHNLHLDADEISAFAENALPGMAKQRYTAHLANCNSCRKNLSNLILRNPEAKSETVHAEETTAISSMIPWHKRLFAFPNLAYTMGALVLVFSGIIGFVVVQNMNNPQNPEVSQISEKTQSNNGIFQSNETAPPPTGYASNANMVLNSNAASVYSTNSMTTNVPTMNSNMSAVASKPTVSPNAPPKEEPHREDDLALPKDKTNMQLDGGNAGSVAEEKQEIKKETEKNVGSTNAVKSATTQPKSAELSVSERNAVSDAPSTKLKRNSLPNTETTTVGGKTFKRQDNVWIDSAYNRQSTANITRGTKQYKKLDKDLRVIAENLGGTIVVVWKEKAYRIQ
ncbi:hypothetical protein BH24ACI2_BH24ACI2_11860 [soil metagenome]|jgi:hypothetical protein|nr:hypothetical protein [Acidobacteriota bacterium]